MLDVTRLRVLVAVARCGSVTAAGVYTAPPSAATCHVVATSEADASKSDTAIVTVIAAPVSVSITPDAASVSASQLITFSATVTGDANQAVTWSVQEATACGSITQRGVYTAPAAAATCHVVATSQADRSARWGRRTLRSGAPRAARRRVGDWT